MENYINILPIQNEKYGAILCANIFLNHTYDFTILKKRTIFFLYFCRKFLTNLFFKSYLTLNTN